MLSHRPVSAIRAVRHITEKLCIIIIIIIIIITFSEDLCPHLVWVVRAKHLQRTVVNNQVFIVLNRSIITQEAIHYWAFKKFRVIQTLLHFAWFSPLASPAIIICLLLLLLLLLLILILLLIMRLSLYKAAYCIARVCLSVCRVSSVT